MEISTTQKARRLLLIGLVGFLGTSLEFLGLMTLYPLLKKSMPKGAAFYKLSIYVYLAIAGGAVHLPCGVFMWLYHTVTDAAGQVIGYSIASQYVLYFILPVSVIFNALRNIGNYPVINGIGASNKSLSVIMVFIALYIGFGKYVRQEDFM